MNDREFKKYVRRLVDKLKNETPEVQINVAAQLLREVQLHIPDEYQQWHDIEAALAGGSGDGFEYVTWQFDENGNFEEDDDDDDDNDD